MTGQFGEPVAGRTVTFQVGADPALTATTNGSGVATVQYTPSVGAAPIPLPGASPVTTSTPLVQFSHRFVGSGDTDTFKLHAK